MSVRALRRGSIAASRAGGGTPTTYTIYGDPADAGVASPVDDPDGSGDFLETGTSITVGKDNSPWGYEGFIAFDTSAVVGTITSVTLSLRGVVNSLSTNFIIEARLHDWGATVTTADWLARATLGTKTLVASKSTVGWSTAGYNALTSEAAFLTGINQSGFTRLVLCSDRHRNGLGSGNEWLAFASADTADTTSDPKLVIETLV